MLIRSISFIAIFCLSTFSYGNFLTSSKQNYFEVGVGATEFGFVKEYLTEYDITPSPNFKLLFGGRLGRKPYTWFELGYQYNGAFITEDSDTEFNGSTNVTQTVEDTYSSHSLSLGLRLTTNPYRTAAGYLKVGGGRILTTIESETTEVFEDNSPSTQEVDKEEYKETFYYGALGLSFQINRFNRFNIEFQQNHYTLETVDLTDNLLSLSWSRFF